MLYACVCTVWAWVYSTVNAGPCLLTLLLMHVSSVDAGCPECPRYLAALLSIYAIYDHKIQCTSAGAALEFMKR